MAVLVVSVGLGTLAQATPGDWLARGPTGSSCDHPLTWELSPRQLQAEFEKHLSGRLGPRDGTRPRPGGPRILLTWFNNDVVATATATIFNSRWRLCAMRNSAPRFAVVAAVGRARSRSEVDRDYNGLPSRPSITITYARRNRARDGASCANPYVVGATSQHGGSETSVASGDRFAGTIQIVRTITAGHAHEYARWHANPGYRTCHATALVDDRHKPWTDFRPSGKHYLSTYDLGGPAFSYDYVYATFARAL